MTKTVVIMTNSLGFCCLGLDHIHFFVDDLGDWLDWYQQIWDFHLQGRQLTSATESIWLHHNQIHLILSQSRQGQGPVAAYRHHHPQGIVDVAFQIDKAQQAYESLKQQGQQIEIQTQSPELTHLVLSIPNPEYGDRSAADPWLPIRHSLIERRDPIQARLLPGFELTSGSRNPSGPPPTRPGLSLSHIDHVVLNVPQGSMAAIAAWYQEVFGWMPHYRYTVKTPRSGLHSIVVADPNQASGRAPRLDPQSTPDPRLALDAKEILDPTSKILNPASAEDPTFPHDWIQLAINEPTGPTSQIQEFLDANHGSGIQHIALHSNAIFTTVQTLRDRGISFLQVPDEYYTQLSDRSISTAWITELQQYQLLIDHVDRQDQDRILLQTFTKPLFPEPTFFYEIIQRQAGAIGFGEANFQALFEAIERDQIQRAGIQTETVSSLQDPDS